MKPLILSGFDVNLHALLLIFTSKSYIILKIRYI